MPILIRANSGYKRYKIAEYMMWPSITAAFSTATTAVREYNLYLSERYYLWVRGVSHDSELDIEQGIWEEIWERIWEENWEEIWERICDQFSQN